MLVVGVVILASTHGHAALLDRSQVDGNGNAESEGGMIDRSLADQIGPGMGDVTTYGSSTYIIKLDPLRSVRRGRQLFQRKFTEAEGLGPRENFDSGGDITQTRRLGAGSADSCSTCHGSPKGSAGFGGSVAISPDGRDAPHLFGLGIIEQLAEEITDDLCLNRDRAVMQARRSNRNVRERLFSKGVYYGSITARPDGSLDTSNVRGVDTDLRVRPFFCRGQDSKYS